jgi:hypothetical protein
MTQGMAFGLLFTLDGRVELAAFLHTAGSWEYLHHDFSKHSPAMCAGHARVLHASSFLE